VRDAAGRGCHRLWIAGRALGWTPGTTGTSSPERARGVRAIPTDGMGRRLSRTVAGTTTKYLYDGATVVQEQDSANSATANLLTGLGIDQALSRTDSAGERSFLTDALGSVLAPTDT
jgi:hypothetical protein